MNGFEQEGKKALSDSPAERAKPLKVIIYLHLLADGLAAEVLDFVEVVCGEAACEKENSRSVRDWSGQVRWRCIPPD